MTGSARDALLGELRRYQATDDPAEKRAMLAQSHAVLTRQVALIERKRRALDELAAEYEERLGRIVHLDAELAREQGTRR